MLTKRLKQNILSTTILIENNKNIYGTSMKNTQDSVLGTQTYNLFSPPSLGLGSRKAEICSSPFFIVLVTDNGDMAL